MLHSGDMIACSFFNHTTRVSCRLTHDMAHLLSLGNVEIVVSLDTAAMGMRGHRVPHTTLLQLCQTHLQLTGPLFQ